MKAKEVLSNIYEKLTESQRKLNDISNHVLAIYNRVDEMHHNTSSEMYLKAYAEDQQNTANNLEQENKALKDKISELEEQLGIMSDKADYYWRCYNSSLIKEKEE